MQKCSDIKNFILKNCKQELKETFKKSEFY